MILIKKKFKTVAKDFTKKKNSENVSKFCLYFIQKRVKITEKNCRITKCCYE